MERERGGEERKAEAKRSKEKRRKEEGSNKNISLLVSLRFKLREFFFSAIFFLWNAK